MYNMHMIFGIYTNLGKDSGMIFTNKLVKYLENNNAICFVHNSMSKFFPDNRTFSNVSQKFNAVITIGGDGTILKIAKKCAAASVPILGFNMGHMGFLTEGEPSDYIKVINDFLLGDFKIEERSILQCCHNDKTRFALNEIAITREKEKIIQIDTFVGGKLVDSYHCDGFIVGTPTGSTAYSLSAGCSILSPTVKAIALTPINSHSLHSRPIIVGQDEKVAVKLISKSSSAKILADGDLIGKLKFQETVNIEIANMKAKFIRLNNSNFYEKLLNKLNSWSYVNAKISEEN